MTPVKTVRALERGLQVLEILKFSGGSTLQQLCRQTGMPKSTLRRLLATLEKTGAARRGLADGLYRANIDLRRIPAHLHEFDYLIDAALPVLKALGETTPWPSDLFVRSGNYMKIVETTRGFSALSLSLDLVGDQVFIPVTAVGRAYLAFCPDAERETIVNALRASENAHEAAWLNDLDTVIERTRKQGYGVRAEKFQGHTRGRPDYIDGLSAIAVPIRQGDRVHGCINQVWPRAAMSVQDFVARNLADLRQAADSISQKLETDHVLAPSDHA